LKQLALNALLLLALLAIVGIAAASISRGFFGWHTVPVAGMPSIVAYCLG
jgi:hypothetical protein